MEKPKDPTIACRPRGALRERFEAYVGRSGLNNNQAMLHLLEVGLDAEEGRLAPEKPEKSKGAPAAAAAVKAKGLPIGAASELPGAPQTANERAAQINAEKDARNRLWNRLKPSPRSGK